MDNHAGLLSLNVESPNESKEPTSHLMHYAQIAFMSFAGEECAISVAKGREIYVVDQFAGLAEQLQNLLDEGRVEAEFLTDAKE
jgi:hypothetical protein